MSGSKPIFTITDKGTHIILSGPDGQVMQFNNWSQLAELSQVLIRSVPLKNFLSPEDFETFRRVYFK